MKFTVIEGDLPLSELFTFSPGEVIHRFAQVLNEDGEQKGVGFCVKQHPDGSVQEMQVYGDSPLPGSYTLHPCHEDELPRDTRIVSTQDCTLRVERTDPTPGVAEVTLSSVVAELFSRPYEQKFNHPASPVITGYVPYIPLGMDYISVDCAFEAFKCGWTRVYFGVGATNPATYGEQSVRLSIVTEERDPLKRRTREELAFPLSKLYNRTVLPLPLWISPGGTIHFSPWSPHRNVIERHSPHSLAYTEPLLPGSRDAQRIANAFSRFQKSIQDQQGNPFYSNWGLHVEGGASGGDKPRIGPTSRAQAWYRLYPSKETAWMAEAEAYASFNRAFFLRNKKDPTRWIDTEEAPTFHGKAFHQGIDYAYTNNRDAYPLPMGGTAKPVNPFNGNVHDTDDAHADDTLTDAILSFGGRAELREALVALAHWWDAFDNNAAVTNPQLSSGPPGRHMSNGELRGRVWENMIVLSAWLLAPERHRAYLGRCVKDRMIQMLGERKPWIPREFIPDEIADDELYTFASTYPHAYYSLGNDHNPSFEAEQGHEAYGHLHNGMLPERADCGQASFQLVLFQWMGLRYFQAGIAGADALMMFHGQNAMIWITKGNWDIYVRPTRNGRRMLSIDDAQGAVARNVDLAQLPDGYLKTTAQAKIIPGFNADFCRAIGAVAEVGKRLLLRNTSFPLCPTLEEMTKTHGEDLIEQDWIARQEARDGHTPDMEAEWRLDLRAAAQMPG